MKQEDEKKSNGRKRGVEHTTWGMGQPKMSGGATTWWDRGAQEHSKEHSLNSHKWLKRNDFSNSMFNSFTSVEETLLNR